MQATATLIILALATLGDMTQIGFFIFMLPCPRWPRQVQYSVAVIGIIAGIIALTFANGNTA
jgi:hypothetical protein